MEQTNKIQSIRELFKNICDTLTSNEINDIRLKIYENVTRYNYYSKKTKLNKKQQEKFNEVISNLNELHEYLLNKTKTTAIKDVFLWVKYFV